MQHVFSSDSTIPRSLLAAALLAFVILVLRIAAVDTPIMASDEYAFFASARFAEAAGQLYTLDPGMQAVGNKVYPALYALWEQVSPDHPALVGRMFNALLFILGSFVLFSLFSRIFDRKSALASALLYLALPFSFYALTLLPEVEFQLSVYLVSMVVVLAGSRPRYSLIALAAVLSALGYFIKPHAAAMIAAGVAYWFATGLIDRQGTINARLLRGLTRSGLYLGLSALIIILVGRLTASGVPDSPGVIPSFYRGYLGQISSGEFLLSKLATLMDYVLGHSWVLMAYFTPGVIAVAAIAYSLLRRGAAEGDDESDTRRKCFALYVALLLLSFLAMIALFTTSAAANNAGELFRLHGRYLAALLPLLLGYSVWACSRPVSRVVAGIALAALISFGLFGRRMYKLYPWDYPDAFGFFNPGVSYWSFNGSLGWTLWLVLLAGAACWLATIRFKSARVPFIAFTLAWMFASHAQMWKWLGDHSVTSHDYAESADAIESYLGPVPTGSGVVLLQDRYGMTTSFLMALDTLQNVKTIPAGQSVEKKDLPAGVSWVVAPRTMDVRIDGAAELQFGTQKLLLLDGRYQWPKVAEKPDWDGSIIELDTGVKGQPALLRGFNDPEEWGSWSKDEKASIQLPTKVQGRVRVSFFAWQLAEHPDHLLRVELGGDSRELTVGSTGRDYQLELDASEADDQLLFDSKVVTPLGEARGLGLALGKVRIEALPKPAGANPPR